MGDEVGGLARGDVEVKQFGQGEDAADIGKSGVSGSVTDEPTVRVPPSGLSRRGWALLVASTGVVTVLALLIVSALAFGSPAGHTRPDAASIPATARPRAAAVHPRPSYQTSPSPTVSELPTVPAQPVSTLVTGDCLQTYPSPWANSYPVVDCAAPHIAQELSTGTLPQASDAPFPGTLALRDEVNDLCSSPDLLNWDWVAIWGEDVQIDRRYPNTDAQWASGARTYYCFIYTQSRHELTGSAVASH